MTIQNLELAQLEHGANNIKVVCDLQWALYFRVGYNDPYVSLPTQNIL